MKYKFLEHTADVKFRAFGKTLNEAFENTALAVSNILSREEKIAEKAKKTVKIEGNDGESLLYNFIEEILYLIDAEDFVTAKAKVKISGNFLTAVLSGDKARKYSLDVIKAPTYAEMYIKKKGNSFVIQAVVDV